MMRLPWQRPLPSNGALNILLLWASGGRTREPILMKFGTQQQVRTPMTVMRSNIKIFKIQNDGRPPYWKYIRNAITRLPMDRLERNLGGHIPSYPRHVRHDAVAMATAAAYQRCIEHSAVIGVWRPNSSTNFWWNSEHNSMLGPQWQSRDQILKFLKFKRAAGHHVEKYFKYHNSPSNWPIGTKLGWSHPITFPTCLPKLGCHGNGRCLATGLATALWTFSGDGCLEAERVNQFWWNLVYNSKFGQQWQSCDEILKVGGRSLLESIRNAITRLQMDRLGRNFGGRIPSCSQYWKCYNSSYDGSDWDDSWVVASKQHLYCKTVSLVFGRYC